MWLAIKIKQSRISSSLIGKKSLKTLPRWFTFPVQQDGPISANTSTALRRSYNLIASRISKDVSCHLTVTWSIGSSYITPTFKSA